MTITELLPKLTEEERKYLQENLKSQKDFYDYFVTKGLTDSFEEFTAFLKQTKKLTDTELSDDELEKVAGGWPALCNADELEAMYNDYVKNWQPEVDYSNGYPMIFDDEPMSYEQWLTSTSI